MWKVLMATALLSAATSTLARADTPTGPSGPPPTTPATATDYDHQLSGIASWYGGKFHGRLTANGEVFNTNELTAAHRTLPFDTIVRVTNETNGRAVVVRINDRGPFVDDRVIDLSRAAADIIGLTGVGIAPVTLEILHYQETTDLRTVQVGSFSDRANAESIVTRLEEGGISAAIETAADLGVHRVIIQGIREPEVPGLRARLDAIGFPSVLVREK